MSWDAVILADASRDARLLPQLDALFAQQRSTWEALRNGEALLASVRSRRVTDRGSAILIQSNPGRSQSTFARVDAAAIARRPCFLCPRQMPAEERGIAFGSLVVLPNPFPVLPRHCTIPSREHQPQQLAGHVTPMLQLARALGPEMLVFYNGPRCGASAPDHLHFQACSAAEVPLLAELHEGSPGRHAYQGFGRAMLVAREQDTLAVEAFVRRSLDALRRIDAEDGFKATKLEPMLNLLVHWRDPDYVCIVVPRAAHRPACYFDQGPARLGISPAALEMAGLLVVAEPEQFDRVDAVVARAIYEEVSLPADRFARLAKAVF